MIGRMYASTLMVIITDSPDQKEVYKTTEATSIVKRDQETRGNESKRGLWHDINSYKHLNSSQTGTDRDWG